MEVHHGEVASMILNIGARSDADMIILGRHTKGKLLYALLGSVQSVSFTAK